MKRLFLTGAFILALISSAFAVVSQENGTRINNSDIINFYGGPDVTADGRTTKVNFSTMTGSQTITGNLTTTGDVFVDDTIYLTATTGTGSGLWLSQPDGGCSFCGVDAAGTTLACTNQTCPPGM